MINNSMTVPEKKQFLNPNSLVRGPDLFRGNPDTDAFVYTLPSKHGRYFSRPGHIGHEEFITDPKIVEAIFGDDLDKPSPAVVALGKELEGLSKHHYKHGEYEKTKHKTLRDELQHEKVVWKHDDQGRLVQPLEKESSSQEYSWDAVRKWGKRRALIGRRSKHAFGQAGPHASGRLYQADVPKDSPQAKYASTQEDVIMLWPWTGPQNGWVPLLVDMLTELNISPNAVVTHGTSDQFSAGDFLSQKKNDIAKSVNTNLDKDKWRHDLMLQYHTATGANKVAIGQLLGYDKNRGDGYPDTDDMTDDEIEKYPWKMHHWGTKMKQLGMLAPGQKPWSMHGDSVDPGIGFSQFLCLYEMGLIL